MKLYAGEVSHVPPDRAAEFRRSLADHGLALGFYDPEKQAFLDVLCDDAAYQSVTEAGIAVLDLVEIPDVASAGSSHRGCHRLGTWNRCPQAFAYSHLLRLRGLKEPPGRATGSLVHLGLMWHYLAKAGRSDRDPIEAMRRAPARIAYTFENARRVFEAYREHYAAEPIQILDVEREFVVRVGGHWHTQRLDLVVEEAGHAVVWDHKTTSGDAHVYPKQWDMDLQFLSATTIGRALFPAIYGLPFGGVVINQIGTAGLPAFARHSLTGISIDSLPFAVETIRRTNDEIEREYVAGTDPWSFKRTWACQGAYGRCEFERLCSGQGKQALGHFVTAEDEGMDVQR